MKHIFKSSVAIGLFCFAGSQPAVADEHCVRYADDYTCIYRADAKNPKIPTFKTIDMLMLSDQFIFPFSGGRGFAKDEEIEAHSCREIKKCEKAFNSEEMWCEVVLSDGFFTGWIKRMDEDFVYAIKGC